MFFIGILWFSFNNFGSAPYLQQVVNDITSVAGRVVSKPINALNGLFSDINNLQNTFEENKELKSKLNELAEMQAELTTVTNENQKLQEELELQATLTNNNTISGTVIARNQDKWIDQGIIDRESRDRLVSGMSVMANNGLIGCLVEVNPTSTKVT